MWRRRRWHPTPVLLPGKSHGRRSSPWGRWGSDTTERLHFHFHALEKEMATHSSVLVWRIPGMGEPGGLLSMASHRVGHDWSDLAAAASLIAIDSLNLAQKVTSQDKNYILQPPLQLIVATWQNSRQLDVKESEAGNFLGETLKGRVMIFFPTPSILLIGAEMDCMHSWFRQIRETLDGAQPLHQALDTYLQPIE